MGKWEGGAGAQWNRVEIYKYIYISKERVSCGRACTHVVLAADARGGKSSSNKRRAV